MEARTDHQVIEGTWEEVSLQADWLSGKRVRVTVLESTNGSPVERRPSHTTASPAERAHGFRRWAESHSHAMPVLSDEAISRESIYADDRD